MLPYEMPPPDYEEDATTWIALADLMTGLMAIFLALSIAILLQKQNTEIQIIKNVAAVLQKNAIEVKADAKTGEIVLVHQIKFNTGEDVLTEEGKQILEKFVPVFAEAVFGDLKPQELALISSLLVEGHSDNTGEALYNMDLSTRRALAIVTYIHKMKDFPYKPDLLDRLSVSGQGQNKADKTIQGGRSEDRKVVFRFDFVDTKDGQKVGKQVENKGNHIEGK